MTALSVTGTRAALPPADLAAAFLYVHDLLRAPSQAQWKWLGAASTHAFHERLAQALGVAHGQGRLLLPSNFSNYESEYIAAFDSGAPHPPVPLIESHYNRQTPVPKVLHENILFYQAFGLQLRSSANETSDHLRHQLEFVAHLLRMEAAEEGPGPAAGQGGQSELAEPAEQRVAQLQRARTEFVQRRMLNWLPNALEGARRMPWEWVGQTITMALAVARAAVEGWPERVGNEAAGPSPTAAGPASAVRG